MVLDFGGSLFPQQGLLNEDGLLPERWQQEGSVPYSFTFGVGSSATIHTVTAGKTLYIKSLAYRYGSNDGTFILKDGATEKITMKDSSANEDQVASMFFDSPLVFATSLVLTEVTACNGQMTVSGWEE